MLGSDLCDELTAQGERVTALTRADLDITDSRLVNACFADHDPDLVINCAAWTNVDLAESQESMANAINGSAVEILAAAANTSGALLVQVSTDFVFDGEALEPYEVNAVTSPLSAYGRSKLLGEIAAAHAAKSLIVRTSWLFGRRGPNFVDAIRRQITNGVSPLRVVADQRGRPTYTPHLARAIVRLARLALTSDVARGVVHYADEPECSWYDFARAIVEESGSAVDIRPVETSEFPRPARRPAWSVLSTERYERLTGAKPDSWRDGLREYLASPHSS